MLRYLITLTLLIGVCMIQIECQEEGDSTKAILGYFESKCNNRAIFQNVTIQALAFTDYLEHAFTYVTEESKEHFCKIERPYLLQQLKKITRDWKPCLQPNDKFLPDFIYQSFEEFLHFLCHKYGSNIDRYYAPESKDCRMKMDGHTDISGCMNKIIGPTLRDVTKTQLCRDMSILRDCFTRNIVSVCPEKGLMYQLNIHLFHYIMKPCTDTNSAVSLITSPSLGCLLISLFVITMSSFGKL